MPNTATTEGTRDGFTIGGRYFNLQDKKPGVISRANGRGWFTFRHDDGTSTILDRSRICTLSIAQARYPSYL